MERQARVSENQLPHPHFGNQPKPHTQRTHERADKLHLRQRSRRVECGIIRNDRQRIARPKSRTKRQYARLRHNQRVDLPLEYGKYQRRIDQRQYASK